MTAASSGEVFERDGRAHWIACPTPPANRNLRAVARDDVEWTGQGSLTQCFTAPGPFTAVHADLTGPLFVDVAFALEVVSEDGDVIASRTVDGPQHIWDRFLHFVEFDPPAPAGSYELRLSSRRGAVGWHLGKASDYQDDGVSPIPLHGQARTNGIARDGVRSMAVETIPAPNPVFRRRLTVAESVRRAFLSGTVLGNGIITVNGVRPGDEILDPAPTDYSARVLYRTWDISRLLRSGDNLIEVEAGRGTFAARGSSVWGWNFAPWHAEPMARLALEWEDETGAKGSLATDADWETASGTTVSDILYGGELSRSSSADPEWRQATVVVGPSGTLSPATLPPIRVIRRLAPIAARRTDPHRTLYDLGTVLSGRVLTDIRGTARGSVKVSYGEYLSPDGRVTVENTLVTADPQVDIHVFDDPGAVAGWSAKFGYRGFRWVEVETDGDADTSAPRAELLHTDVPTMGDFHTDEPVLQWADAAFRRTFPNNLHGIPTDTPVYEKNGWTADAMLATEAIMQHMDVSTVFGKWMQDHADAQDASGAIPQIVPSPGFGQAPDPAWSGSSVIIPWQLYWEYGDITALRRTAPMVEAYADALSGIAGDGLWPIRSWGDWLAPGFQIPPEGPAPTATMMLVAVLQHAARIMSVLERPDLEARYPREGLAHRSRLPRRVLRRPRRLLPSAAGRLPPDDERPAAGVRDGPR